MEKRFLSCPVYVRDDTGKVWSSHIVKRQGHSETHLGVPDVQHAVLGATQEHVTLGRKFERANFFAVLDDGIQAVISIPGVNIVHLDNVTIVRVGLRVCHGHAVTTLGAQVSWTGEEIAGDIRNQTHVTSSRLPSFCRRGHHWINWMSSLCPSRVSNSLGCFCRPKRCRDELQRY